MGYAPPGGWSRWLKMAVFAFILLFYASLITYKIILPAAEDLPRQMMNGKDILHGQWDAIYKNVYSYTNPEHEFANHHWLYGVFAYLLHEIAGYQGIVLVKIVILLCTFSLLFYTSLKKADFWLVAFFSIPTILVLAGRGAARPEMFSYLFVAVYLWLLTRLEDNPDDRQVFWIAPLQILWANLHIMFPLGVALVGSFWVGAIAQNPKQAYRSPLVRKLLGLLILTTAVSFANPWGISGVIYSITENTVDEGMIFSAEVQSVATVFQTESKSEYLSAVLFTPMLIVLAVSFLLAYKKRPVAYILLSIALAFLGYSIIRGLPLFGMVFLPAVTMNLQDRYRWLCEQIKTRWPQAAHTAMLATPGAAILVLLYLTFGLRHIIAPYHIFGVGATPTSLEPIEFIKANDLHGPILNDTDVGSYLTYYLYPDEKVFADNRFSDAYTREFLDKEYFGLFNDEVVWQQMLEKYQFNMIVLNHYNRGGGVSDFIFRRIYDGEWVWVYAGRDVIIFVKDTPEHADVIQRYGITQDNIVDKLRPLQEADDFQGQVAAADLYAYSGHVVQARYTYERVVSQWPHLGRVWFTMGRMELQRADQANADVALALLAIQQAIKTGYKTPDVYSFLTLAYYKMGWLDEAEKALKKEFRFNKHNVDALAWEELLKKARLEESMR